MQGYLRFIYEAITEVPSGDVVGGLLVGLALSLAASGLWMTGRKRISDPLPLLCGLILLVSALSMAFGVGHSRYRDERDRVGKWAAAQPTPRFRMMGPSMGRLLILAADLNKDGRLTAEEAARFVQGADQAGRGWADAADLDQVERERLEAGTVQDFHPDSAPRLRRRQGL